AHAQRAGRRARAFSVAGRAGPRAPTAHRARFVRAEVLRGGGRHRPRTRIRQRIAGTTAAVGDRNVPAVWRGGGRGDDDERGGGGGDDGERRVPGPDSPRRADRVRGGADR